MGPKKPGVGSLSNKIVKNHVTYLLFWVRKSILLGVTKAIGNHQNSKCIKKIVFQIFPSNFF
jgi:hypothetical protein